MNAKTGTPLKELIVQMGSLSCKPTITQNRINARRYSGSGGSKHCPRQSLIGKAL